MAHVGRELVQDAGIIRSTFCGKCGYNLRTRPTIGRCPECGNDYDARPQGMQGIFLPQDIRWPWGALGLFLLSSALATPLLTVPSWIGKTWVTVVGLLLAAFAVLFLSSAIRQGRRMLSYRKLLKSVDCQEADLGT